MVLSATLRNIELGPPLLAEIPAEVAFAGMLIHLPLLQSVFGTAGLPGWVLILLLPCPVLVWGADEALRFAGAAACVGRQRIRTSVLDPTGPMPLGDGRGAAHADVAG